MNMPALTPAQIKEIEERIDCGECCYYLQQKGTWVFIPDFEKNIYAEEEFHSNELAELKSNFGDYIKIEAPQPG